MTIAKHMLALILVFTTTLHMSAQSDITPPKLVSVSFTPTTVDITATDQTVTVTITVSDNLSGIDTPPAGWLMQTMAGASLRLKSPSTSLSTRQNPQWTSVFLNERNRQSGSATNGVYTNTFIVPRYSETGRWTIDTLQLGDLAGNTTTLDFAALVRSGLSNCFTVQGLTNDITPPEILEFNVSPITNDVSLAGQILVGQVRVRDDMGLDGSRFSAQIDFESPMSRQRLSFRFQAHNKASGNSTEAVYTNSALLPRYSETGTWRLLAGSASDAVGNWKSFNVAKLASISTVTEIQVQGQGDTTPPQLLSFSLSQTNFNTTLSNGTMLIRGRIKDDLSGILSNAYNPVMIAFGGPGNQVFSARFSESMRESGDSLDGFYTNLVSIPTYLQAGLWLPIRINASDAVGNVATWNLSDLSAQGWGSGFTIQNSPAIAAKETAGTMLLAWPTTSEVFYLEGNTDLTNAIGWSPISTQPVELGGQQIVPLSATTSNKFFRLNSGR